MQAKEYPVLNEKVLLPDSTKQTMIARLQEEGFKDASVDFLGQCFDAMFIFVHQFSAWKIDHDVVNFIKAITGEYETGNPLRPWNYKEFAEERAKTLQNTPLLDQCLDLIFAMYRGDKDLAMGVNIPDIPEKHTDLPRYQGAPSVKQLFDAMGSEEVRQRTFARVGDMMEFLVDNTLSRITSFVDQREKFPDQDVIMLKFDVQFDTHLANYPSFKESCRNMRNVTRVSRFAYVNGYFPMEAVHEASNENAEKTLEERTVTLSEDSINLVMQYVTGAASSKEQSQYHRKVTRPERCESFTEMLNKESVVKEK